MLCVPGLVQERESGSLKGSPTTTRWQAQINSSFDALLGFASSELDQQKVMHPATRMDLRQQQLGEGPSHRGTREISAIPEAITLHSRHADSRPGTKQEASSGRSESRSDSRDSGLSSKDSCELEALDRGPHSHAQGHNKPKTPPDTPTTADSGIHSPRGSRASPRSPRSSHRSPQGSPSSGRGRSRSRSNDSPALGSSSTSQLLEKSLNTSSGSASPPRPRSRSRSRSPHDRDSTSESARASQEALYDRHFKKKFFGKEHRLKQSHSDNTSGNESMTPTKSSSEGKYGKFRPKGKNWEANKSKDSGSSSTSSNTSGNTSGVRVSPAPSSSSCGNSSCTTESTSQQQQQGSEFMKATSSTHRSSPAPAPSGPYPKGGLASDQSAFSSVGQQQQHYGKVHKGRHSTDPVVVSTGRSSASSTPQPSPTFTPSSTGSAPLPAGSPASGPLRPSPDVTPHGFAELARGSLIPSPFSRPAVGDSGSRTAAASMPPPLPGMVHSSAALLAAGGLDPPQLSRYDFEGPRLAMFGELGVPRGGFGVSFGGPPTFRAPFGADLVHQGLMGLQRPGFGDMAAARPSFSGEPQPFNPLGPHGKSKSWKAFSASSSATSSSSQQ